MESKINAYLRLKRDEPTGESPFPMSLSVRKESGGEMNYDVKQTTPFKPYADPFVDMTYDPYSEETKGEIDDYLIESFVNKILTNQAVSLAEGKDYDDFENSFYDEDKVPEMYKIRSNSSYYLNDKSLPKKKQTNVKRGNKKKPKTPDDNRYIVSAYGEFPVGSKQFVRQDGAQMITLTVNMMRQYMFSEVDARVRHINEYYGREWNNVNRERMQALSDLIKSQEKTRRLQDELDRVTTSMLRYKKLCSDLSEKLNGVKDAKKRRRQARKLRKSENPQDCNDGNEAVEHEDGTDTTQRDIFVDNLDDIAEDSSDENIYKPSTSIGAEKPE